jgi:hypothetical protein
MVYCNTKEKQTRNSEESELVLGHSNKRYFYTSKYALFLGYSGDYQ